MNGIEDSILKYAIINAVEHGGSAQASAVLGKLIAEDSKIKSRIKELMPTIKKTVKEVNSWGLNKQKAEMEKLGIEIEKKVEKQGLPELKNAVKGEVVMRMAPYPSGPLHIGNARMVLLNDEYVKRYEGKLVLLIDDTIGSKEKFVIPEAYDMIIDGLKWLGVGHSEPMYKSDRMEIFYKYAKEMIERGFAYVCTCAQEDLRKNRVDGKECACRNLDVEEGVKRWKKMLKGDYKEGQATVRLKTDMNHPNPAFRDRVLLRIAERDHPRVGKKYRVWPMLEYSWAIDDHEIGVTHILRGKDLVIEDMMEEYIWDKMGWPKAEFIHYGLLNVQEAKLSKTAARRAIERDEYTGWDDPRTWSIQSLRRRGIRPQAIRNFIKAMGLSLADATVPAEILYAENRKLIDAEASRYFAVLNPVKTSITGAMKTRTAEAPLHPEFPKRGSRRIPVNPKSIYIESKDMERLKGEEVGLMNLATVKLGEESEFKSGNLEFSTPKVHWVSEPNEKIRIVMPDGSVVEALAEPDIKNAKVDDVIQLMRIGFCRVDKVSNEPGKERVLYFSHK